MSTFVSPAEGRVTSEYGPRHLAGRAPGFHRGIDIAPPVAGTRGHPVYAAYGGTVRAVRTGVPNGDASGNDITGTWNTGNFVLIDGPGGGSEWYGHLDKVAVRPGQKVKAGQQLGTMGDSGNVSGVHLHFERWLGRHQGGGAGAGNTQDPRVDFDRHGIAAGSKPARTSSPPKASGRHTLPDDDVRARLKESGAPYPHDGLLSTWVQEWQERQLYAPGLIADGVWGPASEGHYLWTKHLQRTMRGWRGERTTAVDGDYYTATEARVSELQDRNQRTKAHPRGVYLGALDDIPGPVFCQMLGITAHPGL